MRSLVRRLCLPLVVLALFAAPAAAQAAWGAIAIDPDTGSKGIVAGKQTAAAAQRTAKDRCGQPHCKVAVWVSNGWGAVVRKKSGLYIAGLGRTKAQAFLNARKRANEPGARAVASVFSGLG